MVDIPFRQKVTLTIVALAALLINIFYDLEIIDNEALRIVLLFYGFFIPFTLLGTDLLVDLNDKKVFRSWLVIGIIFGLVFFLLRNNENLILRKETSNDPRYYRFISSSSADVFKCLPLFLSIYWILNALSKKARGKIIVSTFRLNKWYSDAGQRKVKWIDVLINVILCATIFIGLFLKI